MGWGLHKCISSFVVISRKKCKIDALFSLPEYVDLVARASETHTWRWWRKKMIYSVWVEHVLVYYYIFITQINCLMSLSVSSQSRSHDLEAHLYPRLWFNFPNTYIPCKVSPINTDDHTNKQEDEDHQPTSQVCVPPHPNSPRPLHSIANPEVTLPLRYDFNLTGYKNE